MNEQELIAHYDHHVDYDCPIKHIATCVEMCRKLGIKGRGQSMCDLGCGTGEWVARARLLGFNAFGVDYSPKRILKAKERFPNHEFHEMRIQDAAEFFDAECWTLWDVLEHLEDPLSLIKSIGSGIIWGSVPINMPYTAHLQVFDGLEAVCNRLEPTRAIEWQYASRPYALLEWIQ